jgi:hypothetical protein
MPQVRFETTIPVFERAKTVHDLDHAATVIGHGYIWPYEKKRCKIHTFIIWVCEASP